MQGYLLHYYSKCQTMVTVELNVNILKWDCNNFMIIEEAQKSGIVSKHLFLLLSRLINFYFPENHQKTYGFFLISDVIKVN